MKEITKEELLEICIDKVEHGIDLLLQEQEKCAIAHFSCLYGRLKSMQSNNENENDPT